MCLAFREILKYSCTIELVFFNYSILQNVIWEKLPAFLMLLSSILRSRP